jgi:hypothetical protein
MSFHSSPRQCHLCLAPFTADEAVFRTMGEAFAPGDPCHGFSHVDLHWACYAAWPHRERLAGAFFRRSCALAQETTRWGLAARTPLALVVVNAEEKTMIAEVVIARTGAVYRVPLEGWSYWLATPAAAHPFEQATLDEALAPLRLAMGSAALLLERAVWPGRDRSRVSLQEKAERRPRRQEAAGSQAEGQRAAG